MSGFVELVEVGPRDGLQNEPRAIATADKIALVDALSLCGFKRIEATAFVSPRAVPQMADASAVMAGIQRPASIRYAALAPNLKGYAAARAAGVDEVAVFGAASEGFSRANINASIDESLERFAPVAEAALDDGVSLRGYISCVTDCPYEGPVAPASVARVAEQLAAMGCSEVSLGDTIGTGTPDTVHAMLTAVLDVLPASRLAGHFHDTGGRAIDNIETSLALGLRVFDTAAGGLGGCPYALGAPGNVATLTVHNRLTALGWQTGLDRDRLAAASAIALSLRA